MTEEQTVEADAPPAEKKPPTEAEKEAFMLAPVGNRTSLDLLLKQKSDALIELVGKPKIARFLAIVKTQSRRQPELLECTRESMMDAVILCALTGCMPGPMGHMYLIPRYNKHNRDENNKPRQEVSPMLGYKGLLKLSRDHPMVALAEAKVVYDGDDFHVDHGNHTIRHIENAKSKTGDKVTHAYSRVYLKAAMDYPLIHVFNREQIEAARAKSQKPTGSFWKDNYAAMSCKSVIRSHHNGGQVPLTDALEDAISQELEEEFKEADVIVHDVAGSGVGALKAQLGITDPTDDGAADDGYPDAQTEVDANRGGVAHDDDGDLTVMPCGTCDQPVEFTGSAPEDCPHCGSKLGIRTSAGGGAAPGTFEGAEQAHGERARRIDAERAADESKDQGVENPPPNSDRDIIMEDIAKQTERLQINRASVMREASLVLGKSCTDLGELHIDTLSGLLGALESKTEEDFLPF